MPDKLGIRYAADFNSSASASLDGGVMQLVTDMQFDGSFEIAPVKKRYDDNRMGALFLFGFMLSSMHKLPDFRIFTDLPMKE